MAAVEVQGTWADRFAPVVEAFGRNFSQGLERGASVAVTLDGELVVDAWGGAVDDAGTPWQRDTIINVWSTTKTMTALCALLLADAGELDVHAPVARWWPEFAANGKERVEVRHLLAHSAGLPAWEVRTTAEDLRDWDLVCSRLAEQAPWWEPGTAPGYHAVSQGNLVGEVVRRITGQSLGTFFAKELAGPLDADFHIGTPPECDDRVALVIPPPPPAVRAEPGSIPFRTFTSPFMRAEDSWEIGWRRAEIPAAGGHGNARSVAQVQSVLACGGEVGGHRFLSEAGCRRVLEPQVEGVDLALGLPVRYGLGYGLVGAELPLTPNAGGSCFWGGWGGSLIVVDLDARMTVAYVMDRMGDGTVGDARGYAIVQAAYQALQG